MSIQNSSKPLTARQLEVLTYVRRYWQTFRCPPSVREVCLAFGIASPQGMQRHLKALERKGVLNQLVSSLGVTRGYEVTSLGLTLTARQDLSALPMPTTRRGRGKQSRRAANA